jgi:hypothetical protein
MRKALSLIVILGIGATSAWAALDGMNLQADAAAGSLNLLAAQDTQTQFGDATVGNQAADFGSELDFAYGVIDSGLLKLSLGGNLEGNFNKMWIFFDAVPAVRTSSRTTISTAASARSTTWPA